MAASDQKVNSCYDCLCLANRRSCSQFSGSEDILQHNLKDSELTLL